MRIILLTLIIFVGVQAAHAHKVQKDNRWDCDTSTARCLEEAMDKNRKKKLERKLFQAINRCSKTHKLVQLSAEEMKNEEKFTIYMQQANARVNCEKKAFDKIKFNKKKVTVIFNKNLERNETRFFIGPVGNGSFYDIFDAPFREVRGSGHYIRLKNGKYSQVANTEFKPYGQTNVNNMDPLNSNLTVEYTSLNSKNCGSLRLPKAINTKIGVLGSDEFLRVDVDFTISGGSKLSGHFVEVEGSDNEVKKDAFNRTYAFQSLLGKPKCN